MHYAQSVTIVTNYHCEKPCRLLCNQFSPRTEPHLLLLLPPLLQSTIHDNLLTSMRAVINGMNTLSIVLANKGNEVRSLR